MIEKEINIKRSKKMGVDDEEWKFTGTWRDAIKKAAPDSLTVTMRGKLKIKTRPSDLEAFVLFEQYQDKTFGEMKKILDDAQFWLHMITILSFENAPTPKEIERGE